MGGGSTEITSKRWYLTLAKHNMLGYLQIDQLRTTFKAKFT